jgi:hypothetical protein
MKKLCLIFICFSYFICQSQIKVDSVLDNVLNKYHKTGAKKYLMVEFSKFESENSSERYDIYLDSTNNLLEYIGLSIIHYSYDSLKRIKIIEGFNQNGELSYWDFPPLQKFSYTHDTLVPKLNKIRNEVCACINPDSLGMIIRIYEYYNDTTYNKIRINLISSDSLIRLKYSYNINRKLSKNSKNVAYTYREYDKKTGYLILHERYYDKHLELVNGVHMAYKSDNYAQHCSVPYAYSIREIKDNEIVTIKFYNKNHLLVDTYRKSGGGPYPGSGIINKTTR